VRFNTASTPYPRAKKFESATLYYGPTESPVHATAALGDSAFSIRLTGSNPVNAITWNTSTPTSELSLNFSAKESPLFYGISLAQRHGGVLVHNIAMRGGSGTVFHQIDRDALREMYKQCHTGLIIMQFGGNVMPYIEDEQACVDYGRWFYNQLMILKGTCPGASIIVIGPSDMSIKTEDYYQTYPLLESVRDALRDAALKAGAGFWDMYEAMGGKNSMPSWVVANPPLAATDYTHFSPRGARTIAEMFYKSLILEYDKHLSQKAPKS
jgi:lysophospholipase L1-like esterase